MSWIFNIFSFLPFRSSKYSPKPSFSVKPLYFGEVIGEIKALSSDGYKVNVTAYSNDDIYSPNNDHSNFYLYSSEYKNPIYTGKKWECIEFVRRFFILTKDITFPEIDHAYEIWNLPYFVKLKKGLQPIEKIRKKKTNLPCRGDILVWSKNVEELHGHVAIAVGVSVDKGNVYVAVIEQNWDDRKWRHSNYSRVISLSKEPFLIGWIRML